VLVDGALILPWLSKRKTTIGEILSFLSVPKQFSYVLLNNIKKGSRGQTLCDFKSIAVSCGIHIYANSHCLCFGCHSSSPYIATLAH